MRILIIGGTRFLGPHVVRRLCDRGHEVALFHRGRTRADLPDGVRHILGDRRNLVDFADEFGCLAPHVVLDMIPAAERDALDVVHTFTGIARRVTAISSQDVYRAYGVLIGIEARPVEPIPLTEDSTLRLKLYPYRDRAKGADHALYHYEKILVERAITGNPGLPGTVLRLPMVYGQSDPQHRIFGYLKPMDDGRSAILLGEGMARWRWTTGQWRTSPPPSRWLSMTIEPRAGSITSARGKPFPMRRGSGPSGPRRDGRGRWSSCREVACPIIWRPTSIRTNRSWSTRVGCCW